MILIHSYHSYFATIWFNIPSNKGATIGFNLYKSFEFKPYQYVQIYANSNYNLASYENVHPELGNQFYAFEFGITFKGWFTKTEYE